MAKGRPSYGQILRSTSIVGGSQALSLMISLVRVKLVAVLLGPSGVGLVGLYTSVTGLLSTVAGVGIDSSGMRQIARAEGRGSQVQVARTYATLRRLAWVTGVIGWVTTALLSHPLSRWMFGSADHALALAVLGASVLLATLSLPRTALLHGKRQVVNLARVNVFGSCVTTALAVAIYFAWGASGIVPVLLITSVVQFGFASWYARGAVSTRVAHSWGRSLAVARRLLTLGSVYMYGAVLAALLSVSIRAIIVRHLGLEANGIYQAAWAVGGMFVGFIMGAMATDFYPRITATAHDNAEVNRLVKEQIEVGVLLALPGLLATLTLAPWIIHILYTRAFADASALLLWISLGLFVQVITFPLGFIQGAKGYTRYILASQTHINVMHLTLVWIGVSLLGLNGAAIGFVVATCLHGALTLWIARRLTDFRWNRQCLQLLLLSFTMCLTNFACQLSLEPSIRLPFGLAISLMGGVVSLRGLCSRLGEQHRLVAKVLSIPGARALCRIEKKEK